MRILWDYEGRPIRLSEERPIQVLEQAEMSGGGPEIARTASHSECVVVSGGDPEARSYYRRILGTLVGDKLLCVVVKSLPDDAFVLRACLTDRVKRGQTPWPTGK